jgi:hypothetical protein
MKKFVRYTFAVLGLLLAGLTIGCQSSGEQINKALEEQLNTLQGNMKAMESTVSGLQQRVEFLEKENLELRGISETIAAKLPKLDETVPPKDIKALNWLLCWTLGMPFDYATYLTERYGAATYSGMYIVVEFGDGTKILVGPK